MILKEKRYKTNQYDYIDYIDKAGNRLITNDRMKNIITDSTGDKPQKQ